MNLAIFTNILVFNKNQWSIWRVFITELQCNELGDLTNFPSLFQDVFNFYYSRDRDAIKVMLIAKKKEEREARRIRKLAEKKEKRKKTKTITNEEGDEIEVTDDEAELSEDNEVSEEEEPSDDEVDEEILKTPSRNDPYSLCKRAKIHNFTLRNSMFL